MYPQQLGLLRLAPLCCDLETCSSGLGSVHFSVDHGSSDHITRRTRKRATDAVVMRVHMLAGGQGLTDGTTIATNCPARGCDCHQMHGSVASTWQSDGAAVAELPRQSSIDYLCRSLTVILLWHAFMIMGLDFKQLKQHGSIYRKSSINDSAVNPTRTRVILRKLV